MFCTAWPEAPLTRLSSAEIDDGAARRAVLGDADEGHVGAAHVPGLRRLAERQHMHERLVRVGLLKDRMEVLRPTASRAAHIDGRQDAAVHRHEMRREAHDHLAAGGLARIPGRARPCGDDGRRHRHESPRRLRRTASPPWPPCPAPVMPDLASMTISSGIDRLGLEQRQSGKLRRRSCSSRDWRRAGRA